MAYRNGIAQAALNASRGDTLVDTIKVLGKLAHRHIRRLRATKPSATAMP